MLDFLNNTYFVKHIFQIINTLLTILALALKKVL